MLDRLIDFGSLMSGSGVTYYIPPIQRNYKWDEEQCLMMWDDIVDVAKANKVKKVENHFFGYFIYYKNTDDTRRTLLDGQQRLTTATLFLAALRDTVDDESLRRIINLRYLLNDSMTLKNTYEPKLVQIEADAEVYNHIILEKTSRIANIQANVWQNYKFFCNQIASYLDEYKTDKEKLDAARKLLESVTSCFLICELETEPWKPGEENPQKIFEGVNSRGIILTFSELVRSYLLYAPCRNEEDYESGKQTTLYRDYWQPMETALGDDLSDYIRDVMTRHSGVYHKKATSKNAKDLYNKFKATFADEDCEDVLRKMYEYSDEYAYIIGAKDHPVAGIRRKLDYIRLWKMSTMNLLLFDVLVRNKNGELSNKDAEGIIGALLVYGVRRRICGEHENENKGFVKILKEMPRVASAKNKKNAMFDILANREESLLLPNDNTLKAAIMSISRPMAKNILIMTEEEISKNHSFDIFDLSLELEHIMPQTLSNEWKEYLGEDYEKIYQDYINCIGNLSLTYRNKELSNKPFDEKTEYYKNGSNLQISKSEVVGVDAWNAEAMKHRTEWLTDYIVANVLSIPKDYRDRNNYRGGSVGGN